MAQAVNQNDVVEIISSLIENETLFKNIPIKVVKENIQGFLGKDGILEIILGSYDILVKISNIKINQKKILNNTKIIIECIDKIITQIAELKSLNKDFDEKKLDRVKNVLKIIDSLYLVSKNIAKFGLMAPLMLIFIPLALLGVRMILWFVIQVLMEFETVNKLHGLSRENIESIKNIIDIINSLWKVELKIILLGLLAPILILLFPLIILTIIGISIVIICVGGLFEIIQTIYDLSNIELTAKMVQSLLARVIWIILLIVLIALAAPILFIAAPIAIITILILFGFFMLIQFIFGFLKEMAKNMIDDLSAVALVIIAVMGILLIASIALLAVAVIGTMILERIDGLMTYLISLISIITLLMVLGAICVAAIIPFLVAIVGFALMIAVLVELLIITALLWLISEIDVKDDDVIKNIQAIQSIISYMMSLIPFMAMITVAAIIIAPGLAIMMGLVLEILALAIELRLLQSIELDGKLLTARMDAIQIGIQAILKMADELGFILFDASIAAANILPLIDLARRIKRLAKQFAKIQEYDLQKDIIKNNIETICDCTEIILNRFSDEELVNDFEDLADVIEDMLDEIEDCLDDMVDIVDQLVNIQNQKLDSNEVKKKLNGIFGCIDLILKKYSDEKLVNELEDLADVIEDLFDEIDEGLAKLQSICDILVRIQKTKFDKKETIKKIKGIFDTIDLIFERYSDEKLVERLEDLADVIEDMLDEIVEGIEIILEIADYMAKIQQLTINHRNVQKKIDGIFSCVELILNHWSEDELEEMEDLADEAEDMFDDLIEVIEIIGETANVLNTIQEIKLKENKITKNVDTIFNLIEDLRQRIAKEANPEGGSGIGGFFKNFFAKSKDKRDQETFLEEFGRLGEVINILNTTATALNTIQDIKLKEDKIYDKFDQIFSVIDDLENRISKRFKSKNGSGIKGFFKGLWNNFKKKVQQKSMLQEMGRTGEVIQLLSQVSTALMSIQDIKINKTKITNGLNDIFDLVDFLQKKIQNRFVRKNPAKGFWGAVKNWWNRKRREYREAETMKELGRIAEIMGALGATTSAFEQIQSIKLNKSAVKDKLNDIFDLVDELQEYMIKRGDKEAARLESIYTKAYQDYRKMRPQDGHYWATVAANRAVEEASLGNRAQQFLDMMGPLSEGMIAISSMTEALKSIQDLRLSGQKVLKNLDNLFILIDHINQIIAAHDTKKDSKEDEALKKAKAVMNNRTEFFEQLSSLAQSAESLVSIQKLSLNKEKLSTQINFLFGEIPNIIADNIKAYDDDISDKTQVYISDMETMLQSFTKYQITKENVNNFKSMIDNSIRFLDKVNNVKIDNLKVAAQMMEHMANLSESISGDFDGLAEALNENIAPMLKELKEVMEEVPEAIEKNAANLSKSVSVAGKTLDEQGMKEQITRENPKMTEDEKQQLMQQRMMQQAQEQTRGLMSKIDELIDLLKGGQIVVNVSSN